ncbi:hypothetical protein [Rubrivirga sp. SAORIC476]|uniref:hypothetical protein n=1 Tax=Rubrivirga sp. SAORIC476 TaxID=1961794 RepID=UPI00117BDD11|nr:hypothetical protein [Rubrivirga sp. SAORIC476]
MTLDERARLLDRALAELDAACELEATGMRLLEDAIFGPLDAQPHDFVSQLHRWRFQEKEQLWRGFTFLYLSSLTAVVDRVKAGRDGSGSSPIPSLFRLRKEEGKLVRYLNDRFFDSNEHNWLVALRNVCTHTALAPLEISVDSGEEKGRAWVSRAFLLAGPDMKKTAVEVVNRMPEKVDAAHLFREQHNRVVELRTWIKSKLIDMY